MRRHRFAAAVAGGGADELAVLAYIDLELGEAGLDVGRGDPHRQLNASKKPTLAPVGMALRRDGDMTMRAPASLQPSPLVGVVGPFEQLGAFCSENSLHDKHLRFLLL